MTIIYYSKYSIQVERWKLPSGVSTQLMCSWSKIDPQQQTTVFLS